MVMTHPDTSRELARQHIEQLRADAGQWALARLARPQGTDPSHLPIRLTGLLAVVLRGARRLASSS
jgi:hypothetical protein